MPRLESEPARACLLDLFPSGFEERESGDTVELAVYTDEAGEATVRARFPDADASPVDEGWEDRWRAFHRPVRVGGLWIGPPWETPPDGAPAVVVDPGRAFGTGAHPTTRACLELLSGAERGSALDAGCGSGVLAIAMARLGFGPVWGMDADPVAVEVARETARRNGVRVNVHRADVLRDDLPSVRLVVANIELRVVEELLARRPAPVAVTSGYLASEAPSVPGWDVVSRCEVEGWSAHLLEATRHRLPGNAGTDQPVSAESGSGVRRSGDDAVVEGALS